MEDIRALFADYAPYHQTKGNKALHRAGIPLIMLALLGMLSRVSLLPIRGVRIDAALLLIAFSEIFYFLLEWRLALVMLLIFAAFYVAGSAIPLSLNVGIFVLGWIFQFIGHSVYEHKQPAFLKNIVHVLVGPLWILNDALPVVKPRIESQVGRAEAVAPPGSGSSSGGGGVLQLDRPTPQSQQTDQFQVSERS